MDILIGFMLCLFLEMLLWLAMRSWRSHRPLPPLPQPPETPAQQANRELYEAQTRHHPRVVLMRVQRRTQRGPRRRMMEGDDDNLDG